MPVITWVLSNWKLIAGALALIASFLAGKDHTQMKWNLDIAFRVQSAQAEALKNANKLASLEVIKHENLRTIGALKFDLAALRVRVPQPTPTAVSSAAPIPYVTATSGVIPDAPQDEFDKFRSGLESEALRADKIIEDCRVLRDWSEQFPISGGGN